jgi:NADH:ubiquinone oxidoreductase subunit F (NADH-binding)
MTPATLTADAHLGPARRGSAIPPWAPRLLAAVPDPGLASHLAQWGPLPTPPDLVAEIAAAGLRGRGGAGFPTAVKLAATRSSRGRRRRSPVVVANGCEGEPASIKDRTLLCRSPHLVLDGIAATVEAVGAGRAILCVDEGNVDALAAATAAVAERHERRRVEVLPSPAGYVTGQASALVNWLDRGRPLPTNVPPRLSARGIDGRPTVVDNVETLAAVALVARFGAAWWRQVGTPSEPGTTLVTISGGVRRPGVVEVALGDSLADILSRVGAFPATGILVGGYSGTWLTPAEADIARWSRSSLERWGASPGCGVIAVMPTGACPLEEVARVSRWLASQSAGQCGACRHGLPALAEAWETVALGTGHGSESADIARWSEMIRGRGACHLPDGAASFAASALRVFADHLPLHETHRGPCPGATGPAVLPVPHAGAQW